jgi:adenylosuccinate synthase
MFEELAQLDKNGVDYKGRLKLSSRATLVSQIQIEADSKSEDKKQKEDLTQMLGTTKRGIGPSYASKALRMSLRVGDLADWTTFLEKYDRFLKNFNEYFNIQNFDKKKELDTLR